MQGAWHFYRNYDTDTPIKKHKKKHENMKHKNKDDPIIEIETALAHHDMQIAEMSDVITEQWKMIDTLKRRLDKALAKIDVLEHGGESEPPSDSIESARRQIPPHY